jgi:hypothetical protein
VDELERRDGGEHGLLVLRGRGAARAAPPPVGERRAEALAALGQCADLVDDRQQARVHRGERRR